MHGILGVSLSLLVYLNFCVRQPRSAAMCGLLSFGFYTTFPNVARSSEQEFVWG